MVIYSYQGYQLQSNMYTSKQSQKYTVRQFAELYDGISVKVFKTNKAIQYIISEDKYTYVCKTLEHRLEEMK